MPDYKSMLENMRVELASVVGAMSGDERDRAADLIRFTLDLDTRDFHYRIEEATNTEDPSYARQSRRDAAKSLAQAIGYTTLLQELER